MACLRKYESSFQMEARVFFFNMNISGQAETLLIVSGLQQHQEATRLMNLKSWL